LTKKNKFDILETQFENCKREEMIFEN